MLKQIFSGLFFVTLFSAQAAVAGPECTQEPQEKWMSELDMQKKIVNDYGFTMRKFKITDGNCYEIYGFAPKEEGSEELVKAEIYFNPLDGEIVKKKIKG